MRVNRAIAGLTPYAPGKPVDEVARELGLTDIVKLASNENPRGPGPLVQARVQAATQVLSRYPDGSGYALKHRLAEQLGVSVDQITLGNGSNDVLELAARVALEPGGQGLVAEHAFVVYGLAITTCNATVIEVPALNYGADLDAMRAAIGPDVGIVFLANPNNPTGTWVNEKALIGFLDAVPPSVWVVLDEAYFEFVTEDAYPDGVALLARYPNLVVTRTFSKIHGLAGLRVGYALSDPEFADLMNRARQPFNVNAVALAAAEGALEDEAFVASSRALNSEGMAQLCTGFAGLGLRWISSVGNFVCVEVGDQAPAIYDGLLRAGVIVRPITAYGLPRHLRISVGLPEENQRLLDALGRVIAA